MLSVPFPFLAPFRLNQCSRGSDRPEIEVNARIASKCAVRRELRSLRFLAALAVFALNKVELCRNVKNNADSLGECDGLVLCGERIATWFLQFED